MSHIAVQTTKAGEPMFSDLAAMEQAAGMIGCEIVKKKEYTWWGRSVGDYPLPAGMKKEDLGKNAEYVLRIRPDSYEKFGLDAKAQPYELGLLPDPNNPGCYVPMYDFFCGGMGLDKAIGAPLFDPADKRRHQPLMFCPRFKQYYDMCCDAIAAQQAGDRIEFMTAAQAYVKYPHLFPQSTDEETMVSLVDTDARVGAS